MGGINHPDLEVCYWFYHITWCIYIYRNVLNLLNLHTGSWIQHFKTQDKQLDNHWLVTSEQYPISRLPYRTYLPGHCHGLETTHPRLRKVAAKLSKLDTIEQRTVNFNSICQMLAMMKRFLHNSCWPEPVSRTSPCATCAAMVGWQLHLEVHGHNPSRCGYLSSDLVLCIYIYVYICILYIYLFIPFIRIFPHYHQRVQVSVEA